MKIFKNIVFIVLGLSLFKEWTEGRRICHYTTVIDKAGNFQWNIGENCRRITLGGVRACQPKYKESFKQSCYMVVNDVKLDRSEALNVCQRSSSHLLFIESEEERNFIRRITTPYPCDYWLGLTGLKDNLQWDDGTQVNYNSLSSTSYDDGGKCYRIYKSSTTWHDKDCSMKFCYICEYEK